MKKLNILIGVKSDGTEEILHIGPDWLATLDAYEVDKGGYDRYHFYRGLRPNKVKRSKAAEAPAKKTTKAAEAPAKKTTKKAEK